VSLTPWTRAHQGGAVARALSNTNPALRQCWHPVASSGEVTEQPHGDPFARRQVRRVLGDLVAAVEDDAL